MIIVGFNQVGYTDKRYHLMFGEHGNSCAHIKDIKCFEKMLQPIITSTLEMLHADSCERLSQIVFSYGATQTALHAQHLESPTPNHF